jgi:hypothetical protein
LFLQDCFTRSIYAVDLKKILAKSIPIVVIVIAYASLS